jgi:hypothetical protein
LAFIVYFGKEVFFDSSLISKGTPETTAVFLKPSEPLVHKDMSYGGVIIIILWINSKMF